MEDSSNSVHKRVTFDRHARTERMLQRNVRVSQLTALRIGKKKLLEKHVWNP